MSIIVLLPVSDLLASEAEFKTNVDVNYYYSHPRDSYLNPDNILSTDRNRLNLKAEASMKYSIKPMMLNVSLRYFYNLPFAFHKEKAFPDERNIIFLDEARLTWDASDNASLTIGRQRFFWGPGFIKNPINVLNPPTDFRNSYFRLEEKSGVTGIAASFYSESTTVTGVIIPNKFKEKYSQEYIIGNESTKDAIGALKVDTIMLNTDTSFLLAIQEGESPKYGVALSKIIKDIEIHGEILIQKGSRRKYINPQTIVEERYKDSNRLFGNYLIGLRYRTPSGHDFLLEYYRNDSGYNDKETDEFINCIKDQRFIGIGNSIFWQETLRKNYLFFRIGLSDILPKISIEFLSIYNMDDKGYLMGSGLEYRVSEKIKAYINGRYLNGSKESEFGMIPNKYTISSGIKVSLL